MYPKTSTWNPFVGCNFDCSYCVPSFKRQLKRVGGNPLVRQGKLSSDAEMGEKGGCSYCSLYIPHYHPERLKKSSIPNSPIVFVYGTGDISFCDPSFVRKTFKIIKENKSNLSRQYYFQSKNPAYLKQFIGEYPSNSILLTTIETNRDNEYGNISNAPKPSIRFNDFFELEFSRKVLTIEPILDFDLDVFTDWIYKLHDTDDLMYVWIGFNSKSSQVMLPEPSETKVCRLIDNLIEYGIKVRGKELRNIRF